MRDVISQNGASNSWNAERVMAFQPEGKPIKANRESPKAKKGPNLGLSCGAAKAKTTGLPDGRSVPDSMNQANSKILQFR